MRNHENGKSQLERYLSHNLQLTTDIFLFVKCSNVNLFSDGADLANKNIYLKPGCEYRQAISCSFKAL